MANDQLNDNLAALRECGKAIVEIRLHGDVAKDEFPAFVNDRKDEKPEQRKARETRIPGAPIIAVPKYRILSAPGLLETLEGAGLRLARMSRQVRTDDQGPYTILNFTFAPPGNFLKRLLGLAETTPAGSREYFKQKTSGKFGYGVVCHRHFLAEGAGKAVLFHFASVVKKRLELNVEQELGFGIQVLENPEVAAKEAAKKTEQDEASSLWEGHTMMQPNNAAQ